MARADAIRPKGARRQALHRIADDLRGARHVEAYTVSALTVVLTVYNLVGDASARLTNSAILACLAFLVFWTTGSRAGGGPEPSLDGVLRNRDGYGAFKELLGGATEVWMYAPSGVNVLVRHAADIRRWLADGGRARFVVQDPSTPLGAVETQLDDSTDFRSTLDTALTQLAKLATAGGIEYRLLGFSPGFSLVVVNPRGGAGRLFLELHGFRDESIADRMHIQIRRSQSPHWFAYWVARFEAIWETAGQPLAAPAGGNDGRRPS
jgi:hypothetical protein